ncbi:MAG: [FeFe] hydrogenase H-cluster maturation GTPase HydF [bacterium]|nr:[FeFe] hydrogenase H-cluster maturation GTPase HydF [bacterium]
MLTAPKGLRTHIGLFGRMNVGKSSVLNTLANQDVAITSAVPGTTTDVVEKPMELLPLGPVVIMDTAGLDDESALGTARKERTFKAMERSDVMVLVVESEQWGELEESVIHRARQRHCPLVIIINKVDQRAVSAAFVERLRGYTRHVVSGACVGEGRAAFGRAIREALIAAGRERETQQQPLLGDLISAGDVVVMIVPIDLEAPRGRLILPQVHAIRDALDHNALALVVKEHQYRDALQQLVAPPALVICDSQVVDKMVAETPPQVRCTTFSILMARMKGELSEQVQAVAALRALRAGDRVLIAEACSHHPLPDDIGREKLPRWLRRSYGAEIAIEVVSGRDFPQDVSGYKAIIHCGACMLTREEMLQRLRIARSAGIPVTNYGLCIAALHGVLPRVLEPFPELLRLVA